MTRPRARRTAMLALVAVLAGGCAVLSPTEGIRGPAADAAVGGTLRVGIQGVRSLDPVTAVSDDELLVTSTLCDTLVTQDPVSGELVGGIAESWIVSDGGGYLTIKLRRDVTFHDGTPVTPRAIMDSLNRLADPDLASPVAALLDQVRGWPQYRGEVETDDEIARDRLFGIKVASSNAISISLREPNADFIATFAHPATAPVNVEAAAADPDRFRHQPVCAGPYHLTEPWEGGDADIVTQRFDGYHGRNAAWTNGGAGYAEQLVFRQLGDQREPTPIGALGPTPAPTTDATAPDVAPSPEPAVAAPLAPIDDLDVAAIPAWRWEEATAPADVRLETAPGPGIEYIGIPVLASGEDVTDRDALAASQAALRRALSLALDREALAREVYAGGRRPASILPASVDPGVGPCSTTPTTPDLAAAREALAASGIDLTREPIDLVVNDDFRNVALATAVAAQWREGLALDVAVKPVAFDELIVRLGGEASSIDLFRTSWSVPFPSVDAYVHDLFDSGEFGAGNLAGYSNPLLDDLLARDARPEPSDDDRRLVYADAVRLLCQDLPLVPVLQQQHGYAVARRVTSAVEVVAGGHLGFPLLRELHLDDA